MVLSTETFNQSVRPEYSEAVNARYTIQPLWVSDNIDGKNIDGFYYACQTVQCSQLSLTLTKK